MENIKNRTDKGSSKKESFLKNGFGQVDFLFEQNLLDVLSLKAV
ncbi:hypothetical protein LEP1GSC194_2208 [Leptospira alstonii serovar Sichuan str. 79601]|uniref:Uncharacterized protein n=1 Tax=Leptospira alstonii serovar Sichuan str. 79601 TaxID=1218565 RepID=M6CS18_9LEPT|nr:hypothetical protein LEP1GSC194_2208 [Leptospira alstonii serovar Sichuan str. 79601]